MGLVLGMWTGNEEISPGPQSGKVLIILIFWLANTRTECLRSIFQGWKVVNWDPNDSIQVDLWLLIWGRSRQSLFSNPGTGDHEMAPWPFITVSSTNPENCLNERRESRPSGVTWVWAESFLGLRQKSLWSERAKSRRAFFYFMHLAAASRTENTFTKIWRQIQEWT